MLRLVPIALLLCVQDPDVDALLKQLSDESIEVREKATAALVERAEKVRDRLKTEAAGAEGEVKGHLLGILRAIERSLKAQTVLPPVRKVTLDAKNGDLKEVLADLQKQSGLSMDLEGVPASVVSVKVKEALPWEALDTVCKAAGLGYSWADSKIKFQAGKYSETPRAFIRHYLVELAGLQLAKPGTPDLTGSLSVVVLWPAGLSPGEASIDVKSATDDQGRPVQTEGPPGKPPSGITYFNRGGGHRLFPLKFPKADAKAIASLKGTVTLRYPLEEKLLVFESPEGKGGQAKMHEGLSVELEECTSSGGKAKVKVRLNWMPGGPLPGPGIRLRLRLEDGSAVSDAECTVSSNGKSIELWHLRFRGLSSKVTAVEVVVDTVYLTDTFDFELKDIPLPK